MPTLKFRFTHVAVHFERFIWNRHKFEISQQHSSRCKFNEDLTEIFVKRKRLSRSFLSLFARVNYVPNPNHERLKSPETTASGINRFITVNKTENDTKQKSLKHRFNIIKGKISLRVLCFHTHPQAYHTDMMLYNML